MKHLRYRLMVALVGALYTVRMGGSCLTQLTPFETDVAVKQDWSPDGKRIVFTDNADNFEKPANIACRTSGHGSSTGDRQSGKAGRPREGRNTMRRWSAVLTTTALMALTAIDGPAHASVSGPNDVIAFARQIGIGGADVFITNPDGTDVRQVPLGYPAEDFGIPIWSPDRSELLISHLLRFDAAGDILPFRPATVEPDGANFTVLEPPDGPFDMGCFAWHPDGARLLCNFGDDQPGIFSIRASDGGDPVRLTTDPYGAADVPTDVSPDGRRFVFLRYKPGASPGPRPFRTSRWHCSWRTSTARASNRSHPTA
jgi:Tol biopolymer transport system component